ncbi:unnamed protein product [Musa acuminata var. zebrina]
MALGPIPARLTAIIPVSLSLSVLKAHNFTNYTLTCILQIKSISLTLIDKPNVPVGYSIC